MKHLFFIERYPRNAQQIKLCNRISSHSVIASRHDTTDGVSVDGTVLITSSASGVRASY